jgi:hypothetical protein
MYLEEDKNDIFQKLQAWRGNSETPTGLPIPVSLRPKWALCNFAEENWITSKLIYPVFFLKLDSGGQEERCSESKAWRI